MTNIFCILILVTKVDLGQCEVSQNIVKAYCAQFIAMIHVAYQILP
jgi:hypothetical protein